MSLTNCRPAQSNIPNQSFVACPWLKADAEELEWATIISVTDLCGFCPWILLVCLAGLIVRWRRKWENGRWEHRCQEFFQPDDAGTVLIRLPHKRITFGGISSTWFMMSVHGKEEAYMLIEVQSEHAHLNTARCLVLDDSPQPPPR
jgi:hypothetical protein